MKNIVEKIKKLFKLAKSDNEHEAGLALRQAERLMKKHNIEAIEDDSEIDILELSYHKGRLLGWKKHLSMIIAELFFCKTGATKGIETEWKMKYIFIGTQCNVKSCEEIYLRLTKWIDHKARVRFPKESINTRNNYKAGLVYGILLRVEDILQQRRDAENSRALIVLSDAIDKHTENWERARPTKAQIGYGSTQGVADSKDAPIFQEVV